ncbi:MAG: hypothetical protein KAI24_01035 [Planctomycetes bacterium]|nr:hypothetical protein [Planctomycetota bacterium]
MTALTACATAPEPTPTGLVGRDVASLRSQLGAPVELTVGPSVLKLSYLDEHGRVVPDAVIVLGGTVAKVAEGLAANHGGSVQQQLTLAPIDEAIRRLGPVQSVQIGSNSTQVQFAGYQATVVDGLVVGLRKS